MNKQDDDKTLGMIFAILSAGAVLGMGLCMALFALLGKL